MERMSVDILDTIRERCETKRFYRACIYCEDRARARVIQESLINAWPAAEGHRRLSGLDVNFPATGSFVRILTSEEVTSGNARGNKFHEFCVDVEATEITSQIRDALNWMVVPYQRMDYRFNPYADEPCFEHLDIRAPRLTEFRRGEWPAVRGQRMNAIVYDEFAGIDLSQAYAAQEDPGWLGMTAEEVQGRFNQWRNDIGQYEFSINNGQITLKQKETPDFGEFSPSQELNDFVNTLTQG